jgi:hypothetical protein
VGGQGRVPRDDFLHVRGSCAVVVERRMDL